VRAGSGTIAALAAFNGSNGASPDALVEDNNGNLFGTTSSGGPFGDGTVFELEVGSGTITTLAIFSGTNGANPQGSLVEDSSGNLFGTTFYGGASWGGAIGSGYGTVFEVEAGSGTITTLANFNQSNGAWPAGGLIEDGSGNLIGTTIAGGTYERGTVFEVKAGCGTITTLANFNYTDGDNPLGGLVEDSGGNLFGTTLFSAASVGTVFEVQTGSCTITTLATFNRTNGAFPEAGLIEDSSGNFFGTTISGGGGYGGEFGGDGTVFEVAAGTDAITTLATFDSTNNNGEAPYTGLVEDSSGNLFGTTYFGGANGDGTVFEVPAGSGTITTLANFNGTNGANPYAGLVEDGSGNLFGTTGAGGSSGDGTVFEVQAGSGTITTLANFNGTNGANPYAGLVEDGSGNLFGTTSGGGDANGDGTVFEVPAGSGAITTLAAFNGTNGANSFAGLVEDGSGNLFGTTDSGGSSGDGTVFEVQVGSGTITTLASFNGTNGAVPYAGLVEDNSGDLFGTTSGGGEGGFGTVFELRKPTVTVSDSGGTYTGAAFAATAIVNGGATLETVGLTLDYVNTVTNQNLGATAPSAAGNYRVTATFAGSADYAPASSSTTFTIGKATPTVSVSDNGGTYTGAAFAATATVNGGATLETVGLTLDYVNTDTLQDLGATAPSAAGNYMVTASFAGSADYLPASSSANFTIATNGNSGGGSGSGPGQAPEFTSANHATFTVGVASSFDVTTSGSPAPTLTESGSLPLGVLFDSTNDDIVGGPALGTGGIYNFTITADNGVGTPVTQPFTLTVNESPRITITQNIVSVAAGVSVTVTVAATGFPTPTLSESGALPPGVTFNATTGVLGGTVPAGIGGIWQITFTASNGVGIPASQPFTITIDTAPTIVTPDSTTFIVGQPGNFPVVSTGFPVSALSEQGALPDGVTFVVHHAPLSPDTATLSGTPAPGSAGTYVLAITAADSGLFVSSTQTFTLTVDPTLTSSNLQSIIAQSLLLGSPVTLQADPTQPDSLATILSAIDGLQPPTAPVTVTVDLQGGTYQDQTASPPANVSLLIQNGTLVGSSPALTDSGGQIEVLNCTLTTATDAPTILLEAGSLTLRDDVVEGTSATYDDPAISITGGTFDLGTAATGDGENLIVSNGTNDFIDNSGGSVAGTVGTIFLNPGLLPQGTVGEPYSQTITATEASGPVFLAVSNVVDSGTGLTTNIPTSGTNTLTITGTPNGTGAVSFDLIVVDSLADPSLSQDYTIQVAAQLPTVTVSDNGGTYDGSTAFAATATVNGGVILEGVGLTLDYVNTVTGQDLGVAAPIVAGNYTVTATFAGSADYVPASSSANFTIGKATPTVAVYDNGGTYDGSTAFAATATVNGGTSLENVGLTLDYVNTVTGQDLGAAAPIAAGNYEVIASFDGSVDYLPASSSANFTIAQTTPLISVSDNGGTYDGTAAFPATASVNGGASLEGVGLTLDYENAVTSQDLGATAPIAAGSYEVTASFAGSVDYLPASSSANFTIAQATPNVSVSDNGGAYTGTSYSAAGEAVGVDGSTPVAGIISYSYYAGSTASGIGTSTAPLSVGTYTVVASFTSADPSYTGGVSSPVTFTISPYALSYTIGDDSQTYGSPANLAIDLGATINTGVNGENLDIVYSSTGDNATANVGAYAITGVVSNSSGLVSNYDVTLVNGTLNVTPYAFTYTIPNASQTYGSPANLANDLGTTVTTGVNGENLDIVYSSAGDSATANVGAYAITAIVTNGSGSLSNYDVTLVNGALNVTPHAFTYQIGNDSQIYGSPANLANDLGTSIDTGVNGESLDIAYGSAGDSANANAATYAISGVVSSGSGSLSNYDVTLVNGTLNVTPHAFTCQIGNDSQIYGSPANLANDLGATITTGVKGESLDIAYSSTGGTATAPVDTYAITGTLANGTGLVSNYKVTLVNGALTVNSYAFTYQIGNASQIYGSPANLANDLGRSIDTGVNGENLDIAYSSTGDTATAPVGTYAITGTPSNGTGLLSNYNVALVNGTLTVTPTTVTVTAGIAGPPDGVLFQPRIFTLTASGGPGDAASGFTYQIQWGDGSPVQTVSPTANNTTIAESHAYTTTGTFTASVTASDQSGVTSQAATQAITIGLAEVQTDSTGQGGFTGLAISGTSATQGVVLAPGTAANSIKVTRGGTLLGTFVPTGGNVAIYGDGGTDLVTVTGVTNSANTFTLSGNATTFTAASLSPNVFTIVLNNVSDVTLQGGNSGNSFTNKGAAVPSTLIGGTGINTFAFGGSSMGAATSIQGKASNNTLTGPTLASNQSNIWTVNSTNAGNLNGTNWTFTGVQNLVGGANDDHFEFIGAGSLAGSVNGGGNYSAAGDTLDYSGDTAATIALNLQTSKSTGIGGTFSNIETVIGQISPSTPDTLTGPNIASAWSVTGANSGAVNAVNFANFGNLTGGTAANTFTLGANGSLTGTLNGGGSSNTLVGPNLASTFHITANNAGNLANTSGVLKFTSIQNLTGGSQPNVFVFSPGVSISGSLSNGTLNEVSYATNVSVNLQTNKVTGVGGTATNLAGAIGGTGTNTLTGANTSNAWNITGTNAGNINGSFAFVAFANLTGGSVSDGFAFLPGGSISGNLKGVAPITALNYSQYGSPATVNLQTKTATGIAGTWANITNFTGTDTTDTLIGPNAASVWNISSANSGTVGTFTFADFANLTGGTGANTFTLGNGGSLSGKLTGTSSANTLVGPNAASTFNITGSNAGNLNTTVIPAFSGIENLTGGTSPNVFVFGNGAGVTGSLNGGTGGGTLNYASYTTSVAVNLQTNKVTGVGGTATNLVGVTGGSGSNTLTGANTPSTWNITGNNAGNINNSLTFAAFANLTGGTANDTFVFGNAAGVSGTINGGAGTNGLNYSAYLTGVYVNLLSGVATGTGRITNILQAYGSGQGDVLVGNGTGVLLAETAGMNLMIGGTGGQATLDSGSGQDIVIAGSTTYDNNQVALQAIEEYWSTNGGTFAQRVAELSSGITGNYKLNTSTVTHHGGNGDTIALGSANDWLFWRMVGTGADTLTGTPGQSNLI